MTTLKNIAPRRVLVADDNPAILRLITAVVEREGYKAVPAHDGREAYKLLQHDGDFAACIFDMQMPHMQGMELLRYMRTEEHLMRVPVMMMTAEQDPKVTSESFAAGASVFLPKPFTSSRLQLMLRMLIGKSQST